MAVFEAPAVHRKMLLLSVVIETTVAPGTTEFVAYPILRKAFSSAASNPFPIWPS